MIATIILTACLAHGGAYDDGCTWKTLKTPIQTLDQCQLIGRTSLGDSGGALMYKCTSRGQTLLMERKLPFGYYQDLTKEEQYKEMFE